jgi:phosphoglycerate kinase
VGEFLSLDDVDLVGKTVLVRVDINSPLDPKTGRILSDARIREHLATLRDLREAKVAILAHQGRAGKDDCVPLDSHAERMASLLSRPVRYVDSLIGKTAQEAIKSLRPGEVIVLENTRFYAEEEALADKPIEKMAKSHLVRRLAPLANYFVLDAFAAAHRAQPSLVGFCEALPTLAGRVVERELKMLTRALTSEDRPKLAIFGGIKADDSLAVTAHMLEKGTVDHVLATGGVALLFLDAQGVDLGKPTRAVLEKEIEDYGSQVHAAKAVLARFGSRIELPKDLALNADGRRMEVPVRELPAAHPIADIGLETIGHFATLIAQARTIIMNGPAGVFELEPFAIGTRELFTAVAESKAFTVIGGGHTVAVAEALGLEDEFDHVSTGGGALINFLAGRPLPLVDALRRSKAKFRGNL